MQSKCLEFQSGMLSIRERLLYMDNDFPPYDQSICTVSLDFASHSETCVMLTAQN